MDDKKYTLDNEKKNRDDEFEEFNFTDDFPEFSEEFMTKNYNEPADTLEDLESNVPPPPPPPAPERKGNILKRHPLITLIAVLVIVLGGYKLMQSGEPEIIPVAEQAMPKPVEQNMTPISKAMPAAQEGDRIAILERTVSILNAELNQMQNAGTRLEQMERMVTKMAAEERDLSATLMRLDALNKQISGLAHLDQRIKALEAQMEMIAGEVDLHITVAEQTQRAASLSRQAIQAKSMIPIPMVVQAAIPGRAWLLSETGELLTVARGDDVPGYGRVVNIDPVAGTVTMSSETVFREKE